MQTERNRIYGFIGKACMVVSMSICAASLWAEAARGRVQIKNHTVVSDKGTLLRGRPLDIQPGVWRTAAVDPKTYTETAAKGFNCIRLIFRLGDHTIADLDKAVENAEKANMYIILDNHFFREATTQNLTDWWTRNAARWKDRTHVLYEIANEPEYSQSDVNRPAFQESLYKLVRKLAPNTHIICWSAAKCPAVSKIAQAPGISYSNASVGFHIYGSSRESIIALKAKYPVICTEDWLGSGIVRMGEDLDISWIPWVRTSGGEKVPSVFLPEMAEIMAKLGSSYAWTPDFKMTTDISAQHLSVMPTIRVTSYRIQGWRVVVPGKVRNILDTQGRLLR